MRLTEIVMFLNAEKMLTQERCSHLMITDEFKKIRRQYRNELNKDKIKSVRFLENVFMPIGKYKGQPIEILSYDQEYMDWLLSQSWFKEKYTGIYKIIINNLQ